MSLPPIRLKKPNIYQANYGQQALQSACYRRTKKPGDTNSVLLEKGIMFSQFPHPILFGSIRLAP